MTVSTIDEPQGKLDELAVDGSETPSESAHDGVLTRPPLAVGERLGDRYVVERMLGQGGMGAVFLATDTVIDKQVAIKVLRSGTADNPRVVSRFLQEAKASSLIRHRNLVDITDFGHADSGEPYFVMEALVGEDLSGMLKRKGRLPWKASAALMGQICAALQAAHEKGVIHRDMKPSNCFLVSDADESVPRVKVLDFGIAKIVDEAKPDDSLTHTGAILGTAAYMSPEQAQSLPLDRRSDVYSAGVVLYQLVTGMVPFTGPGVFKILMLHVGTPPKRPSLAAPDAGITAAMDAVILKALAKDPDQRYETAKAFADAIGDLEVASARPKRRSWVGAASVVGVGLVGVVGWSAYERSPSSSVTVARASVEPAVEAAPVQAPDEPETNASVSLAVEPEPVAEAPTPSPDASQDDNDDAKDNADADADADNDAPPSDGGVAATKQAPPRPPRRSSRRQPVRRDVVPDPAPPEPPELTRSSVVAVLRKDTAVNDCVRDLGVRLSVNLKVNPGGSASATVSGAYAGTPETDCVVKKVRTLDFPLSDKGGSFTVKLPVR